MELFHLEKKHN